MNTPEFLEWHKQICEKLHNTVKAKNEDYGATTNNPFHNFQTVEREGICSTEQGFMTRMMDKMSRVKSLCIYNKQAKVKDEAIEDTLLDLANYSLLLAAYIKAKNENLKMFHKEK